MLLVISPAKKLDFSPVEIENNLSKPLFQKDATNLANVASKLSKSELKRLMSISDKLADLNFQRFQSFKNNPTEISTKAAAFAFNGDTYTGLNIMEFSKLDLDFSQNHLRILSGLYGLLRPLDLIQPYRLEMGTKLAVNGSENLYKFWSENITNSILAEMSKEDLLINLASNEYFEAFDKKKFDGRIISPVFKDFKNGKLKIISFYAKKARGMMVRYIVDNSVSSYNELLGFNLGNYLYNEAETSDENFPVFTR